VNISLPQAPSPVLSTLESDGSRRWIYPRLSQGRFWNRRRGVAYALLALYTLLPFLRVGGKPLLLLDVMHRQFTILGATFLPTDLALLAVFALIGLLSIFFVTALLGRVWCGWVCPQTVYMEFVFRPVERLFTGRGGQGGRPREDVAAWRKGLMYATYLLICLHLANTFLAYFVPAATLHNWITHSPGRHPAGFAIVGVVAGLMMFNFAWFREQTCTIACPYGRLQSVLLDRQSMVISYDVDRGEPRGSKKVASFQLPVPSENRLATGNSQLATDVGDCVDCTMCVQVCPTGIDIRQGLQLECIGCAQCIDACDAVMDKIGRERGLIRYTSQAALAGERTRIVRPRVIIYSAIVTVLLGVLTTLLLTRSPADVTVLRNVGRPFVVGPDGTVENTLRLKIANRTDRPHTYTIEAAGDADVRVSMTMGSLTVAPGEAAAEAVRVMAPAKGFLLGHRDVTLRVSSDDGVRIDRPFRLIGPATSAATTASNGVQQ
jgi:cytochrome c oxidase accessory protein FixG